MAEAVVGSRVKVHYTGRLDDGTVFGSSADGEPLEFTIGAGEMIEGLEESIVGMSTGDKKTVSIAPEKAFGEYRSDMVMVVPPDQFPPEIEPQVGQVFQLSSQAGPPLIATVTKVEAEGITMDANHPLAGKTLTFDVELVEILAPEGGNLIVEG